MEEGECNCHEENKDMSKRQPGKDPSRRPRILEDQAGLGSFN